MACDIANREGKSPSPMEPRLGRMFHSSATGRRRGATFTKALNLSQPPTQEMAPRVSGVTAPFHLIVVSPTLYDGGRTRTTPADAGSGSVTGTRHPDRCPPLRTRDRAGIVTSPVESPNAISTPMGASVRVRRAAVATPVRTNPALLRHSTVDRAEAQRVGRASSGESGGGGVA